jgi:hypothetical protein
MPLGRREPLQVAAHRWNEAHLPCDRRRSPFLHV